MKKILFILTILIVITASLSFAASDPKLVSTLNKSLTNVKEWIIKLSTPAAAIAVGTGVFMKKFSFGDEERIIARKKINKKLFIFLWFYSCNRFNTKSNSISSRSLKWKMKLLHKQLMSLK